MSPSIPPNPSFASLPPAAQLRLATEIGVGWPDLVAVDIRYRADPRVGFGLSLGLGAGPTGALRPLSTYQAMPAVYLRYYLDTAPSAPFLQFGAGSQVGGLFGSGSLTAAPLVLGSYGYEWRLANGFTASIDGGAAFNFNPNGVTSPSLRIGFRIGYATL
ncbi:MAG: hypothetical protein KGR26_16550 [Cyanobacteria bacterium REEB65]|nr:hypothetical protein [Cyanobacteria bacterium REEB65]